MNEPQINIDHFYHRPTYRVVGLLTEQAEILTLSRDLASAGVAVTMEIYTEVPSAATRAALKKLGRWLDR